MRTEVLKYFTVLAEELHFGRAANRLSITQPPLSTAIKALEQELGAVLLLRNRKMVQLTAAGAAFQVEALKLLEGLSRARSVVKSAEHGITGRLDVGFGGTLVFRDILQIVDRFHDETPDVEIVLHEMFTRDQFEQLQRGQLNAGFAHGAAPPPRLKAIPLKEDTFVLCLPEAHPLAGASVIRFGEVADAGFVMFEREVNPVNHDSVMGMFTRAGIHPRIVHYARNWMTSVAMVSEGYGIAIVPASLARMEMARVRLVALAGAKLVAAGMLAWNPALVTPALRKFLESATHTIQKRKAPARRKKAQA